MTTIRTFGGALALAFALTACGAIVPPPGAPTPEATQFGFVVLSEFSAAAGLPNGDPGTDPQQVEGTQVWGGGAFFEAEEALPATFIQNPYAEVAGTCEIYTPNAMLDLVPPFPLSDLAVSTLDAGDSLTLRAPGDEVYATLVRDDFMYGEQIVTGYFTDEPVAGPIPQGLTLSVPGGEFPAFTNEAFPTMPAFVITPAEGQDFAAIGPDATFTWDVDGAGQDAVVFLHLSEVGAENGRFVTCVMPDTGTFAFPQETVDGFGEGFVGRVEGAGRLVWRVATHGDGEAVLFLGSTSIQEFAYQPQTPAF
jgi:hypothetical protein